MYAINLDSFVKALSKTNSKLSFIMAAGFIFGYSMRSKVDMIEKRVRRLEKITKGD